MYCSSEKRGDGSSDASNALHGWPSRSHGQNRLLWSSNPMPLFEAPVHLSQTPTESVLQFSTSLAAPSLSRQRRPAGRHLPLQASSTSAARRPRPSPAARAQKQSRTQEAPYSAATRCRLLEASKTARAQAQAGYHTHPPGYGEDRSMAAQAMECRLLQFAGVA